MHPGHKGQQMGVTLKDIARRVGRSVTTVSRALNGYNDVSPETRHRILQVAAEMGYTPHAWAQRLQKQRTDTLGLVLPTFGPRFADPFFSEFLAGVGNMAAERGYDLLVSTRAPGEEEETAYRRFALGHRVDGFLLVRLRCQDPRVAWLQTWEVPFVAFGRTEEPSDFPYVDVDGEQGVYRLARHLITEGYRRIAFIAPPREFTFSRSRERGVRRALAEAGLPLREDYFREGALTEESGYREAQALLALPEPPIAIMAGNDLMAIGAMRAVRERGLQIGPDIAITGFDDIPLAQHTIPPLTTVHQPIYQIGKRVTQMLIDLLQGNPLVERQVLLEPSVKVRASSLRRAP
ncbi:MAG TPA: LacI family transcriptional regulator [Anaerolineaceae bacterium]|nr:LacI family transcriptional regulator [Anaerolineaceae bacterium]